MDDRKSAKSRIWRACKGCRTRKIRCNGEEPCAMCSSKNEECVYAETKDRAANSRQYVAQLENRLAQVEASLAKIADGAPHASPPIGLPKEPFASPGTYNYPGSIPVSDLETPHGSSKRVSFDFNDHQDVDISALLAQGDSPYSHGHNMSTSHGSDRFVGSPTTALAWVTESDAYVSSPGASESAGSAAAAGMSDQVEMDELTRDFSHIAVDRRGELRFMGGGTVGILVESLGAIKPRDGQPPPELPFLHTTVPSSGGGRSEAAWLPRATDFGFPPRDVLNRLVDVYFRRVHPLFPILNRPSFIHKLTQDSSRSDTPFVALVFAVCAAASVLVPGYGSSASTAVGNEWLERASILHYRCSRETSLVHVQCLGIMGSYLAAINDLPSAWLVSGQAMRTAQDLGLHRATVRLKLKPSEIQERRRIFWCLYGQDRCMSYALGRSMGIDDADVDVELPFDVDDDVLATYATLTEVKPDGQPSLMSGFIALTQMHIIARKAKKAHRTTDRIPDTADPAHFGVLQRMCDPLDTALTKWLRNLPACIRDATEDDTDPTFWMQSVQCFSQYHTTRMNAFRSVISGARSVRCFGATEEGASGFFNKVRASATSAAGLGTVIRRAIAASHELAFAVEQTLLAGVILARCVSLCREESAAWETAVAARTCVASLAALETWPGAARCRDILEELVTQLVANDTAERFSAPSMLASPRGVNKRHADEAFTSTRISLWTEEPAALPTPNKRHSINISSRGNTIGAAVAAPPLYSPEGLTIWDLPSTPLNFSAFSPLGTYSTLDLGPPPSNATDRPLSPVDLSGFPFPGLDLLTAIGNGTTWDNDMLRDL